MSGKRLNVLLLKYQYYDCCYETNCNCVNIRETESLKCLGIILDNTFRWKPHVAKLKTELNIQLFISENSITKYMSYLSD